MKRPLAGLLCLAALPAGACDIALVLGVDVSNSIDASEYALQVQGMAQALDDPAVAGALIEAGAAIALVQWSGMGEQELSLDWAELRDEAGLQALRRQMSLLERPFEGSDTAVGEALAVMTRVLRSAPDCRRQVVDFAGDGVNNAGERPSQARAEALEQGVVINGLGIDRLGQSVTEYYRGHVIGGDGAFVMTARGYGDFARAFRAKLLREVERPGS
jgi:Ca-activated chloride channel homolog